MVDEVVPLVYVVCSWRHFDIEAADVAEPKSLENLAEKPLSGQQLTHDIFIFIYYYYYYFISISFAGTPPYSRL